MTDPSTQGAYSPARFERNGELHDRPVADLIKDLSQQTQTLVRQELELAKVELTGKARKAGLGAGMFGGAGLFGLFAFAALTACIIAALDTFMVTWLAALVVAVVYGAIAAVLALVGKNKVQEATPPMPESTRESVQADVQSVKSHVRAGRA